MASDIQLYGFDCPFVERSRLLLELKGVSYQYTSVKDFNPAPDWFLTLNPLGKVPVLIHQGKAIYESAIINEYLEDIFPSPAAFPVHPVDKAFCRILIDYCSKPFIANLFALLMNQDQEKTESLMAACLKDWRWLNAFLLEHNPDGDVAFGSGEGDFGMADLSYLPFFSRYAAVAYYRHFELPDEQAYARVKRWRDSCMTHPLAKALMMPEEHIIKLYYSHSQGWGAGRLPPKGQQNSLDPATPYEDRPMPPRPLPANING
ncbi:glutathione S-transferase family protein [Oceanicoccus sagamiensis]|uniref:Glutathione S-transferase n=1 Tax=Oceanicoccus sagamiensis TaxID=716816 RepID=A0A1X9NMU1_9GAMM|nr:glutathione S-transferase family protein [Oceanicoccus sagamiensis]ARN76097.1 hypothetical protein BST96_19545 [Oceanicoccus sagamiensis]